MIDTGLFDMRGGERQSKQDETLSIDALTLVPLVRQVVGRDDAELVGWEQHQFQSLLGPAALSKVYRLSGTARVGGEARPWSIILKALTRPASRSRRRRWPGGTGKSWPSAPVCWTICPLA